MSRLFGSVLTIGLLSVSVASAIERVPLPSHLPKVLDAEPAPWYITSHDGELIRIVGRGWMSGLRVTCEAMGYPHVISETQSDQASYSEEMVCAKTAKKYSLKQIEPSTVPVKKIGKDRAVSYLPILRTDLFDTNLQTPTREAKGFFRDAWNWPHLYRDGFCPKSFSSRTVYMATAFPGADAQDLRFGSNPAADMFSRAPEILTSMSCSTTTNPIVAEGEAIGTIGKVFHRPRLAETSGLEKPAYFNVRSTLRTIENVCTQNKLMYLGSLLNQDAPLFAANTINDVKVGDDKTKYYLAHRRQSDAKQSRVVDEVYCLDPNAFTKNPNLTEGQFWKSVTAKEINGTILFTFEKPRYFGLPIGGDGTVPTPTRENSACRFLSWMALGTQHRNLHEKYFRPDQGLTVVWEQLNFKNSAAGTVGVVTLPYPTERPGDGFIIYDGAIGQKDVLNSELDQLTCQVAPYISPPMWPFGNFLL
jgi:hypothetical protein